MCLLGLNGSNQPNNQKVTKSKGESLKLDCGDYTSVPEASVTWSRRDCDLNTQQLNLGDNVVTSVDSRTLYFRSLTGSHNGCYQCVVTNGLATNNIMGSYELVVNGEYMYI